MPDHRTGFGGREREMGDARNRSPPGPSRIEENRSSSSSYRNNLPPPHRSSRRSRTPPSSGRRGPQRSASLERQRERDYAPRRLAFNDEGFDFQHKYMLPDHPTDLSNVGSSLLRSSSASFREILVQKSVFLDDGSKHTFFSLPQELQGPLGSVHLNSAENMRSIGGSSLSDGLSRYHERLRDPYDDDGKERVYSRDVSFREIPPPLPQARPFVGTSSSSFSKESDLVGLYGDPMRRAPLSPPPRVKPLDYRYDEIVGNRGRDDHLYLPLDDPYHKMVYDHRDEFRNAISGPSILDLARGRVGRVDASLHGDTRVDFNDVKRVHEDYAGSSGRGYAEFGLKASRGHEHPLYEESFGFGRDSALEDYRERASSSPSVDRLMLRHGGSPSEFDLYDPSLERMDRRKYVMSYDVDGRNVYRRIQSSSRGDEMWSNEEHGFIEDSRRFLLPKRPGFGHSKYRMPSHKLSRNDKGSLTSLKKRLRPGSITWERKQDLSRPHKVWKRSQDDKNGSLNGPGGHVLADSVHREKKDPLEDSEEFKQQVLNAFFRFSKLLNESLRIQKMYRHDQGKSSNLLCCACGSLSKEFVDTHSLLAHSFHSLKVGLRTEHLGFHKALCVLNGWNWLVAPDAGKEYMRRLPSEIKALKEDLILWPPVVIIHNASIGNKSKTDGPKLVSIKEMGELLKEMGFGAGKTQVCRGKPANQSVLLVKFQPLFSGLQEAERLHKYYVDNNRGKAAFRQIASGTGSGGEAQAAKDEEFLYGYLAVAEDLDKLDPETKKRCLVKSKKDIEAIVDAPLNTKY